MLTSRRYHMSGHQLAVIALCLGALKLSAQGAKPTIVIDPGHPSEVSSGAAIQNGTSEVHIAWQVAQRLATLLRAQGYRVILTKAAERTTVTNLERARIGNAARAALVVRLHCDASADSGFAIYHPDRQGTAHGRTGPSAKVMRVSAAAAESMHASMAPVLAGKLKDGGVRGDSRTAIGEQQGALTGSIFSEVPVVLIEMVTLSNEHDAAFIRDAAGQLLMARAIASGIARYAPVRNSPRIKHDSSLNGRRFHRATREQLDYGTTAVPLPRLPPCFSRRSSEGERSSHPHRARHDLQESFNERILVSPG